MSASPPGEPARPLRDVQEAAGAAFESAWGVERVRDYGDPVGEYSAAVENVALGERPDRRWLLVSGREPRKMLSGMLSGRMPDAPSRHSSGIERGRAEGSALLDPRGRMLAEMRVSRVSGAEERYLLEVPTAGMESTLAHFRKFLPPRWATFEDASGDTALLTVLGAGAASCLARDVLGLRLEASELEELADGDLLAVTLAGGDALTVVRNRAVATPAWDLVSDRSTAPALWQVLVDGGARPAGALVWETLRVEAGRPEYGVDMDTSTIPAEAGIGERVVDYSKGCFTGQEVLIRIRDRGHVNRHLRGLRLGRGALPAPGTALFRAGEEKPVGTVTSAVESPRFGERIGLGYARREVSPGSELRLGGPDGPPVTVHDLGEWGP